MTDTGVPDAHLPILIPNGLPSPVHLEPVNGGLITEFTTPDIAKHDTCMKSNNLHGLTEPYDTWKGTSGTNSAG